MELRRHFTALDACRGLAAITVAASHTLAFVRFPDPPFAFLGVDFFFMLSGLVIAHAYEERLATGGLSAAGFLGIRLIRLHPILILGTLLGLICPVLSVARDHDVGGLLALSVLAILGVALVPVHPIGGWQNGPIQPRLAFPINGPTWSMFAEYFANILYGLGVRHLTNTRLAIALLVSGSALIWLILTNGTLCVGFSQQDSALSLVRVAFPFLFGVAIHRLRASSRLPKRRFSPFAPCLILVATLLAPAVLPSAGFCLIAVFVLLPLTLLTGLGAHEPAGINARIMTLLGRISYPLYALHAPLVPLLFMMTHALFPMRAGTGLLAVLLLVPIAIAYAASRWFDEPVREWVKGVQHDGGRGVSCPAPLVMPAQAGILPGEARCVPHEIPACAGMTGGLIASSP